MGLKIRLDLSGHSAFLVFMKDMILKFSPFSLFFCFSPSLFLLPLSICPLPSLHISSLPLSLSFSLHPSLSSRMSYITASSFRGNCSMCLENGMGEKQDEIRAVCTPGF